MDFAGVQIGKKFYLDPDSDTDSDPDKENTEGYLLVNLSGKVILIHTLLNIYEKIVERYTLKVYFSTIARHVN